MQLSKQVAIRITESDLKAARLRANHMGMPLSQIIRIWLAAFGRGDLFVSPYIEEAKSSISPASSEPTP